MSCFRSKLETLRDQHNGAIGSDGDQRVGDLFAAGHWLSFVVTVCRRPISTSQIHANKIVLQTDPDCTHRSRGAMVIPDSRV